MLSNVLKLLDLLQRFRSAKLNREIFLLTEASKHCREVFYADLSQEAASFHHEKTKVLYDNLSTISDGKLDSEELEIAIKAIGATRILYWASRFTDLEDCEAVVSRYLGHDNKKIPHSLASMVIWVKESKGKTADFQGYLEQIKQCCRKDIADLEILILKKSVGRT